MTRLPKRWEALGPQRERERERVEPAVKEVCGVKQYPLHAETLFPSKSPETALVMACDEYVKRLNSAFYEGFITASLETKEEADAVGMLERVLFSALAMEKSAKLHGAPDPGALETVTKLLTEEETPHD